MSLKGSVLISLLFHGALFACLAGLDSAPPGVPALSGSRGEGAFAVSIRRWEERREPAEPPSLPPPAPPPEPSTAPPAPVVLAPPPPERTQGIAAAGEAGAEAPLLEDAGALRPVYPLTCRRELHEGLAVVRVRVGADGEPGAMEVIQSAGCPDLDRAALEAMRRARFRPARRWGRPVPWTIEQPFRFKLGE